MVLLSVIIPAYNESGTIGHIIRYLKEQKFDDMEILFVVDSKTTDDTLDKIHEKIDGLNYEVIIQTGDGKQGEARNIGLENASGEYVWFLDADDRPYPDFVTAMINLATRYKVDIVQCNFLYSHDLNTPEPKGNYKVRVFGSREALFERSLENIPITPWSMIHRREFLMDNELRFHHGGCAEDVDFTYRVFEKCDSMVYYDRPLYLYHQNPASICSSMPNELGKWEAHFYSELEKHFKDTWFGETFSRHSAVIRIRSAGRMDRKKFIRYLKSDECLRMMNEYLRDPLSWDYLWVSVSPYTYHVILNIYLKFIYSRNKKLFDSRMKGIRKLFKRRRRNS